jgi:phosphatidylethanolamine/phosphatidyl-N-methylethanolamine N-methyltransferase
MATKNIWEYWRPVYGFTWALMQRSSYRHLIRMLRHFDGPKVVLDIGCGTGEYIRHLPRKHTYRFVDIDAKSLDIARRECERHLRAGHWSVHCMDAERALTTLGPADVITAVHVISVVDDPLRVIELAKAALNPRGELLMYISRMSKRLPRRFDAVSRLLGFHGVNLRHQIELRRRRAGLFNECYHYVRGHERPVAVTAAPLERAA